jgi:hypothetical protein
MSQASQQKRQHGDVDQKNRAATTNSQGEKQSAPYTGPDSRD